MCRLDGATLSKVGGRDAGARRQRLAGPLIDHSGELAERIACGRDRIVTNLARSPAGINLPQNGTSGPVLRPFASP